MSGRSYFRRAMVPLLSLLLVGGAAFVMWREPFRARKIKREMVEGSLPEQREGQLLGEPFAGDPVALRVCEELVADPQWHERLPLISKIKLVQELAAANSEVLTPGLQATVAAWNRERVSRLLPTAEYFARIAIETLLRLDTASARAALRELEREFPPFPSPYAITLPHYLRRGKRDEVRALAHSILDAARQLPDPATPGRARYGQVLEDLDKGLEMGLDVNFDGSAALPAAEVMELRLSIFLEGGQADLRNQEAGRAAQRAEAEVKEAAKPAAK
jgi:hypothetical protein